jgi:hypothetical protein
VIRKSFESNACQRLPASTLDRQPESLEVDDRIAKKKHGRRIPMHPELRAALATLRRRTKITHGPIIRSRRAGAMRPNSIVNWFIRLYQE